MIGNVYSRLTVLAYSHSDKKYNKFYKCRCACGKEAVIRGTNLTNNKTKSCGCYAEEFRKTLEDKAKQERRHITHKSYTLMMQRCYQPSHKHYVHFGAEGITVCDRWRYGEANKTGWECFFEDMGAKPLKYSLGRKNKLGPYTKDNCKWTTSNNQFADVMRSGRRRDEVRIQKEQIPLSIEDAWIKRCLNNPKRKNLSEAHVRSLMVPNCPLLEIPMIYELYTDMRTPIAYATLDKIDPCKGYVEGNVQIISHRANMIKSDSTIEEFEMIAKNWRLRT